MTLRELREQNGKSRAEVAAALRVAVRDEIFSLEKKKVGTK